MLDDLGYAAFQRTVLRLTGVDLTSYRQGQMRRRLESLVQKAGSNGFGEYAKLLERNPARLQEFRDYFTINVTEFFRDVDRFRHLETRILPELLKSDGPAKRSGLRVWSAACSIGAEPYSVAILLKELAPTLAHKIVATDVDMTVLGRARRGDGYLKADVKSVAAARLAKAFTTDEKGTYAIKPEYRSLVEFRQHNLLTQPPSGGFDLILCRNVVIYFTDEAKAQLYKNLVGALRRGGVLFVGGTEMVAGASGLGLTAAAPSFYRKDFEAAAVPSRPRLAMAGV